MTFPTSSVVLGLTTTGDLPKYLPIQSLLNAARSSGDAVLSSVEIREEGEERRLRIASMCEGVSLVNLLERSGRVPPHLREDEAKVVARGAMLGRAGTVRWAKAFLARCRGRLRSVERPTDILSDVVELLLGDECTDKPINS